MAKKDIYFPEAERLYVIEQMTINEIALRLPLNEKTVRNWKNIGNWEIKRKQYLKSKQSFHEELYEFSRKLMHSIKTDLDNGKKVDTGRFYTFTRLLPLITKVKEYEDISTKKDDNDKGLTKDLIKMIEEEVLGIQNNRGNNKC